MKISDVITAGVVRLRAGGMMEPDQFSKFIDEVAAADDFAPDERSAFCVGYMAGLAHALAVVDKTGSPESRLKAFGRDCVTHGDMTPGAARMLNKIADEIETALPGIVAVMLARETAWKDWM